MEGLQLLLLYFIMATATEDEIKTECGESEGNFPISDSSPSLLAGLKVELVTRDGMLNISWAINIDASVKYLTATRIVLNYGLPYHCEYNPPFAKANLTGLKQKWFHYLINATDGLNSIQAANIPRPPPNSGPVYQDTSITVPPKDNVKAKTTPVSQVYSTTSGFGVNFHGAYLSSITTATFGCVASVMILSCCYIIYKHFRAKLATSLCFNSCPSSSMLPVPILVVYPAENSAFQRAVVALAEFLQWHGGCSVAVDMWQQGKIAELGPMRWLAEQAKAAHRVLIVLPQKNNPFSYPSHSPNYCFPTPSIPAAAQDLYPLVLNMVVSHAKSSRDLAKFWVVQLCSKKQDKRCDNLVPELRSCKTFCVMRDLKKLCRSLHEHRQGTEKIPACIIRPGTANCEKDAVMLREAVEKIL
ncbi:uncharacterized protein LOC121517954 [Cheilinus undulatus]|uniref:uncharacterized protein LOC121517954 n=1 Tax=Cheilinus undulatus TaxID=241271 RepID=UPI001BD1D037|nr:uncharacterized protein LOC121517954 [Cheilinus undulatus]